ncbi:MAG: GNAT family N-acetyltransferase [Candidatus Binataceae bacterium]
MAEYRVRRMRREEMDLAIEWAAAEGWNPGLNDAALFYDTDPQAFFIGELDDEPVASLSGVAYGSAFGFIGLYIVRPEFRGRGYGLQLWREVMKYLGGRNIGLDGVPEQQPNYMKSGFTLAYRNIRYEGVGTAAPSTSAIVPLESVDSAQVVACDAQVFPAPRADFVCRWNSQPNAHGRAELRDGQLTGYAVMRRCRRGHKIGPLTAIDEATAEALFAALSAEVPGEPIFLDVPEVNPRAVALVRRHGMTPAFETARMYNRSKPSLPLERIYGVCTFELG